MVAIRCFAVVLGAAFLGVLASACAAEDRVLAPIVETIPVTTPTTVTTDASVTDSPAPTPPTSTPTTPSTQPRPPGTFEPGAGGAEPEGLPEFIVAVRNDHAVIEIDTGTGRRTRTLIPPPEPDPPNAEIEGNRIGAVWWHRETDRMLVEDGPEPAAGNIWHQPIGADFAEVRDRSFDGVDGFRWGGGWQADLSPNGDYALHTGYFASILRTGVPDDTSLDVSRRDDAGSVFYFTPTWLRDRVGVAFTVSEFTDDDGQRSELEVVELDSHGEVTSRRSFPLVGDAAGIAVRADGAIVVLVDDGDLSRFGGEEAIVIDPDTGATIAEFGLEPGSHSLGYDPTGTYLLYVDGGGTIRWQGRGQSGTIATGFIHADW